MFKSYVIEYGSYILAGVIASVVQHSLDISFWQFWVPATLGIVYYVSLPTIHHLAWGKDH